MQGSSMGSMNWISKLKNDMICKDRVFVLIRMITSVATTTGSSS
jgi:hypothetical protein